MKPLAIITGASSGIGEAAARSLSAQGHPLLLLARRLDRLEALKLPDALCRAVDVRQSAAVASAIAEAEAKFGPTDLLVNNAGVMYLGDIASQEAAQWQDMFDINVVALLAATQLVLPGMKQRGGGTVMNIGSIAGRNVYGNHTAYCGTKFAVHAISESLRREVASSGVRVVVIAPGLVETELLDHTTSDAIKIDYRKYKEGVGGGIPSSDVADAIVWAYGMPKRTCIREVVLAPTTQDA
ncbi:MAG: SDR family oxidoreductase [Devosia nanyangense]|uniref:SDR family oxidoreductase n=1 Tax=Devosia nanyangense TaxID=1228055 RepID=A0A933L590_9HYPH|nr:SDR family oxidoreductase [Devosia nanyangense]